MQSNAFLLAALDWRVQGVTFLPTHTWAKFVGILWLACHSGPRARLRRGGKEHNLGAEIKKPIFCCSHLQSYENKFLDAFSNLRMSVSPSSFLMESLGSNLKNFYEIWYMSIFLKSAEKIQGSLKSDKNNKYFTWRPIYIYNHISHISS
jgi:hypothetical protein